MKCETIRQQLVELLYGESTVDEQQVIEKHLAGCTECRNEWERLELSRDLLNQLAISDENPAVDVTSLCRLAVQRSERRSRNWKWMATALGVCAALLLVVFFSEARIEFSSSHLVVAWGKIPVSQTGSEPVALPVEDSSAHLAHLDRRLNALDELTNIAARDYLQSDQRYSTEMATLKQQLEELKQQTTNHLKHLQVQSDLRWKLIRHDLSLQPVSAVSINSNID